MDYKEKESLKNDLVRRARDAWETQQTGMALAVLKELKETFWQEVFTTGELTVLKTRMNWVAFPVIPEKDQLELITGHLLLPLYDSGFDIQKSFDLKRLITPPSIWPEEAVPSIIDHLLQNQERISPRPFRTKANQEVPFTVENWLKDYVDEYGMDKQEEVSVVRYLSQSQNFNAASDQEKNVLKNLLLFFESIKVFSVEQIFREMQKIAIQEERAEKEKQQAQEPQLRQAPSQEAFSASPVSPVNRSGESQIGAFVFSRPMTNSPSVDSVGNNGNELLAKQSIKQALATKPQITTQEITGQPITLLGKPTPVAPTVQNWILDYRSRFGVSGHTPEDQQSFLRQSPNTKNLSEKEKQAVLSLIDSYDNDSLLNVSETNKRIVF